MATSARFPAGNPNISGAYRKCPFATILKAASRRSVVDSHVSGQQIKQVPTDDQKNAADPCKVSNVCVEAGQGCVTRSQVRESQKGATCAGKTDGRDCPLHLKVAPPTSYPKADVDDDNRICESTEEDKDSERIEPRSWQDQNIQGPQCTLPSKQPGPRQPERSWLYKRSGPSESRSLSLSCGPQVPWCCFALCRHCSARHRWLDEMSMVP